MSQIEQTVPTGAEPAPTQRRRIGKFGRLAFIVRRFGFYLVTAWVAVTLNFIIPRLMPGDPGQQLLQSIRLATGAAPTPEQVEAVRRFYGEPTENLLGQYIAYLGDLTRGDLGTSVANYPLPVSTLVLQALPWTLLLIGATTIISWVIGTLVGAYMGWKPGSKFDSIFAPVSTFIRSLPSFWLALVALWIFAISMGLFPISGAYDPNVPFDIGNFWFLLSVLHYGFLPAMTLIFIGFTHWLFSMRNVMVTTVTEDYVLMARAKGLRSRRVLLAYAARNALLPNVTGLALAIGGVIGGTVLVEAVFTYPGMGNLLQLSISQHDFPVMQAILLMLSFTAILANFIADVLYAILDPRTKESI